MEADLPMQQLSEMFNINHFIISQANPHAVFLASFNRNQSVWSHGLFTFIHGVLVFLKKQVKAWIGSMIEMIGAQRAAPIWDTRRGFGSQFFTQEYEGRETDITLVPWANHRSLLSALLHVLYNPSEAEFRDWIHAAERETWRYIPKIKSHVAEEITLDQCVQRLRKRLILETIESRSTKEASNNLSNRVPSFFTSPSLVNLSGLAITDPYNKTKLFDNGLSSTAVMETMGEHDVTQGWKGMGLKGNFSSGSLNRSSGSLNRSSGSLHRSSSSGIFPLDEDECTSTHVQNISSLPLSQKQMSDPLMQSSDRGYVKTTTMANFYYKNACGLGQKPPLENKDSFYADTNDSSDPQSKRKNSQDLTLDLMSV
jgi:TAG lipase/steryl ester hydrolase/phospholipase A2/LPA acyltransferase